MKLRSSRVWVQDIYLVLEFETHYHCDYDNKFILTNSWETEVCRVTRCFTQLKMAKKYQKYLNKKGLITGLIKRRLYSK